MSVDLTGMAQMHFSAAGSRSSRSPSTKELSRELESIFLQQLLTVMKEGLGQDGLFEGTTGQDLYTSMMDQALARALSQRGGIGLAEPIFLQLNRQESGSPTAEERSQSSAHLPNLERRFSEVLSAYSVSSPMGWRHDPIDGERKFHRGVDFAIPEGSPVKSVISGTVVFSGVQGGYGNTVIVEGPGDVRVRYAHLQELSVRQGDQIAKGERIGVVGTTGRSTGPHLHLEVEAGGRVLNPLGGG